jgi:hypothetical protein
MDCERLASLLRPTCDKWPMAGGGLLVPCLGAMIGSWGRSVRSCAQMWDNGAVLLAACRELKIRAGHGRLTLHVTAWGIPTPD